MLDKLAPETWAPLQKLLLQVLIRKEVNWRGQPCIYLITTLLRNCADIGESHTPAVNVILLGESLALLQQFEICCQTLNVKARDVYLSWLHRQDSVVFAVEFGFIRLGVCILVL